MTDSVKVAEFEDSDALVEVFQKYSDSAEKIFFDITCATECVEGDRRYLLPLIRIGSVLPLVISVLNAMEYISNRHKEIQKEIQKEIPKMSISENALNEGIKSSRVYSIIELDPNSIYEGYEHMKEFRKGSVVAELLSREIGDVNVFHVCCWREFVGNDGERQREFLIQQRDLRDLVNVLIKTFQYYQKNWGATSPVSNRRW